MNEAPMNMETDEAANKPLIFLSHSSRDKLIADAICGRLEQLEIRCWIAPRDVNPGRDYSDQIAEALERSSVMVMVFSSGSNSSRHVKSEIDRAFSLGQIIIPFRVENIEPEKGLAYYLSKTHWLDAVSPPLEEHIDRLAATIRKLSGDESPPKLPTVHSPVLPSRPPASNRGLLAAGIGVLAAIILGVLAFVWLRAAPDKAVVRTEVVPIAIEGAWKIAEARTLNGSSYSGTVHFTKQRDRYHVTWDTSAGSYSGFGLVKGNNLCVGWSAKSIGVVFYSIGKDGTLEGAWTVIGASVDQSDGIERAAGGVPGRLEGQYRIIGSNPGGQNSYGGLLEIIQTGETYQLQWNVAGSLTTGVGIKIGAALFVAYGGEEPFGVVAYRFDGEHAKGVWTLGGASQTGVENITKQ